MSRALLAILLATGCTSSGSGDPGDACVPGDDPVSVMGTEVRDHYVRLDVQHSGGCEAHAYAVWWSGQAALSDPPQIPLELQHYANGDSCDALISTSLWVDLSALHRPGFAHGPMYLDFVRGNGASGNHLARVEYTIAAPAPAPAADVITIDRSCSTIVPPRE